MNTSYVDISYAGAASAVSYVARHLRREILIRNRLLYEKKSIGMTLEGRAPNMDHTSYLLLFVKMSSCLPYGYGLKKSVHVITHSYITTAGRKKQNVENRRRQNGGHYRT